MPPYILNKVKVKQVSIYNKKRIEKRVNTLETCIVNLVFPDQIFSSPSPASPIIKDD